MTQELTHKSRIASLQKLVTRELAELVPTGKPDSLYEAVKYVLTGGGKRFRPVLTLLSAEIFGVSIQKSMPAALAMEVFHSFTLVIDDVMDQADSRRGRPTVHVVWDVDTALLCGKLLLALSYQLLTRSDADCVTPLTRLCSETLARLSEGQAMDKAFEKSRDVSTDDYIDMVDRKTCALVQSSLKVGGILGNATQKQLQVLTTLGTEIGRAFQMQDDLLDLVAKDSRWGKPIGGDLIEGKKTILVLEALRMASGKEKTWFERIYDEGGLPPDSIDEARSRMQQLGVLDKVRDAVIAHSEQAVTHLHALPTGASRDTLQGIILQMQERVH